MLFDRCFRNFFQVIRLINSKINLLLIILFQSLIAIVILLQHKLISIFKAIKLYFNYNNLLIFVKLFCLIILLNSGFSLTSDYLNFPFKYNIIVSENKYGFDFPSISVCTDNNVLFDKTKIIEHFGLHIEWNEYENLLYRRILANNR